MDQIRVLLADDHPLVRAGIRSTLMAEQDLALVGEAATGDEARRLCAELCPDVLLLDLSMPGPPPAETVAYLREHCPQAKVVALTAYDDDVYIHSLIEAGAMGYVLKDEAAAAVVRAIRAVHQGDTWFSRPVIEKLAQLETAKAARNESLGLTERERRILRLIALGQDNASIAAELSLAEQTVRNYVSHLYAKLDVSSRTEAALWARRHGLAE
jgi:DNA-binding NarL/FixJ family response regulator